MTSLSVVAPAKLNLFLHITGKRADGYHLLESLVAFTNYGDVLDIEPSDNLILSITGEFADSLSADENNLVMRAAKLLRERENVNAGAHITLHKNLPIGSGFGGGSSDAAATLNALAQFWDISFDASIAMELGSDVLVCIASRPAYMRGVGEQLMPVRLKAPLHVVLLHPRTPLLTADVYRHFSGDFTAPMNLPAIIENNAQLLALLHSTHNALDSAAIAAMPSIAAMLAALDNTEHCLLSRMSGSGAGCFAFYETAGHAAKAAEYLKRTHIEWWCVATHLEQ